MHIAHGVRIGKHCLIAAQTGISGKTIIGDGVVIYGQVGIAQTLKIGDRAIMLAKSGVSKDLPANGIYFGYPASEARQKQRIGRITSAPIGGKRNPNAHLTPSVKH